MTISDNPQSTMVEVELLFEHPNSLVLRMTTRRFPGILIQGDTLKIWYSIVNDALEKLQDGSVNEAVDSLRLTYSS